MTRPLVFRLAAAVVLCLVAGLLSVATAQAATAFTSTVVNSSSGQCATVPNGNSAVQLTQTGCNSGAGQSFRFTPVSGDVYTVSTFTSGSCVDIYGASTADNAAVIQYACHSGTNQQFRLQAAGSPGGSAFTLVAVGSGKCVTVVNALLVQLACGTAAAWRLPGYQTGGDPQPQPVIRRGVRSLERLLVRQRERARRGRRNAPPGDRRLPACERSAARRVRAILG